MKKIPNFKTDLEAQLFLEQDLSSLDFNKFKPMVFEMAKQERVAAHTERLKEKGGTRITLLLQPEPTRILTEYCKRKGVSRTAAIEKAIREALI